jgi:[ribosomal protein S18]-alanine N-acetyltransferase
VIPLSVKEGSADDLPAVMAVMAAAFDPRFGESWSSAQCLALLALPGATLFVARRGGPVGFALARTIAGDCELMMLGVLPAMQRQGVGRALLDRVIDDARKHGAEAIFLEVRSGNPAIDFYRVGDFAKVGTRARYYRGSAGEHFDAETHRLPLV